jgi:hypothetical membrane protein
MKKLLAAGLVAAPILYYFGLFAGAAAYPGYDHITRYASELGAQGAPHPEIFNYSILAMGASSIVGALGLALCLRDVSGRWLWPALAGLTFAIWGASMIMGGLFPMPDERHGAYGMGLVQPLAPLFTLLALLSVPKSMGIKLFVGFILLGSLTLLAIMMGVGELVRVANVGAWQRTYTAFAIPWTLVLGLWLIMRKPA